MSAGFTMQLEDSVHDGYTIKNICGCRVVFGLVPASDFHMLVTGYSDRARMATDIADKIGASFVIGEPDGLQALRQMDLPVSEARQADFLAATQLGLPAVAEWLRTGERGASSNAMCKRIFGVPAGAKINHPYDPDDLRRCLQFLDAAGAHEKVTLMSDVSPSWARLIERWNELVMIFREEMEFGRSAPKTYALMQEILAV